MFWSFEERFAVCFKNERLQNVNVNADGPKRPHREYAPVEFCMFLDLEASQMKKMGLRGG